MTRLDRLEALEKVATRGPWFQNINDLIGGTLIANVQKPAHAIDTRSWEGNTDRVIADMICRDDDAALIVEARNLLPALIAVARAAQAVGYELHHNSMHFHERAMADPFEAEAFVQEEGAKLLRALAPLLDEGDAR